MTDFFSLLYRFFGLIPWYSEDMDDHLRGLDITCTDYIGKPWYIYIGSSMLLITVFSYALQYHIIDSTRYNKRGHWWISALIIVLLNFFVAFIIPFNTLQSGNHCPQLSLAIMDCIGLGASNAIWSFLFFILITSFKYPRSLPGRRGGNCRQTTFWKP